MKKIFLAVMILLAVWSCSKKATPAKSETGSTNTAAVAPATATNPAEIKTAVPAELIAAGKTTFETKCGHCHALKNPGDYTVIQWGPLVDVMSLKAKLTDTEKANVLAYVQSGAKP